MSVMSITFLLATPVNTRLSITLPPPPPPQLCTTWHNYYAKVVNKHMQHMGYVLY